MRLWHCDTVAAKRTEDGDEGIGTEGGVERRGIGLMRLFKCLNLVTVREQEVNVIVGIY